MTSGARPVELYQEVSAASAAQVHESDLVSRYGPLVRRIAHHLSGRLPRTVEIEDLIQAGLIGLIEAARKFDPTQGASFETFAGIRIRGAMIDEVRPCDWTPRSVHRKARELGQAIRAIESRLGREARDAEIMAELGIDSDAYHALLRDINSSRMLSIEALVPEGGDVSIVLPASDGTPESTEVQAEFRRALAAAIENLPEREKQVMSMYYDDELNLREIGAVLGVSESRVCQIHAKVIARLRADLCEWHAEFVPQEIL